MSAQTPADGGSPEDRDSPDWAPAVRPPVIRVLLITAVCIGIAALAAAAFVLSYGAVHAFASQAGVPARLARAVPVMLDAMLLVALAATLALRGAGLPSRLLAWVVLLAVLAAAAGADTLHADDRTLGHHVAAVTVAVVPWALVFLAFLLLLAMLRHARIRRLAAGSRRAALAAVSAAPGTSAQPAILAHAAAMPVPLELPRRHAQSALTSAPQQTASQPEAAEEQQPGPEQPERRHTDLQQTDLRQTEPRLTEPRLTEPRQTEPRQTEPQAPQGTELPITDSLWDRLAGPRWEAREAAQPEAADADPAPDGAGNDQAADDIRAATAGAGEPTAPPAEPEPTVPPAEPEPAVPPAEHAPDVPVQLGSVWERPSYYPAGGDVTETDAPAPDPFSPAPTNADDHQDPDMPVFHRLWSSPAPPAEHG